MPCLNEQETIGHCVAQARDFLERHQLKGEVLVADNGSTDRSVAIAQENGARVIAVAEPGYGNALRAGFAATRSQYIIMGDSDGNHDLSNLMPFVEHLLQGYDLVVGNRFAGGIEAGSMTWMRQYIGNPFLSFVGRLFFHTPVRDFNCGLRGIRKEALDQMQLHTTGMEFASEMIVKASLLNLKVVEVPTRQLPDAPGRESHLHPLRDGWRHLRFLLLYSPAWLFLYPGLVMLILGAILSLRLLLGPISLGNGVVDFHSLIYAGAFSIIGLNLLSFSVITHVYALHHNLLPRRSNFSKYYRYFQLERGVLLGGLLLLVGVLILIATVYLGLSRQFSDLGSSSTIRLVYSSSLLLIAGTQILFTSFVLSILGLKVSTK
jgi:glycosyltransferase involved in cell wall biosynthesis